MESSHLVKESVKLSITDSSDKKNEGSIHKQLLIAICVNLGHILVGFVVCWTAPMIPKLQRQESNPLPAVVSITDASWIAAAISIGVIIGAPLSGYMSNLIGRKITLILAGICHLIGNFLLLTASSLLMVYLGRMVSGLGVGGTSVVNMVYIGEMASPKIRGMILTSTGVSHTCGSLLVYSVAPFVSYSVVGYIGVIVSTLYVLGGFYILESPVYYAIKGKNNDARTTLLKLGRSEDIENELGTMIQNTQVQSKEISNWLEIFSLKRNRKPFLIATTAFILQQTSGIMCIMFFATAIFQRAGSSIQPDIATIILGVTQFFGTFQTPFVIEKFGRRTLMLISSLSCGLCTALLGVYFYLEVIKHPLLDSIGWMPLALLVSFLFFFNAGLGIIPNVLVGEMFSPNVRSTGSSIAMCLGWVAGIASAVSFGYIITASGSHAIFAAFTISNVLAFFFTAVCVPETKGKSLMEIQDMMAK